LANCCVVGARAYYGVIIASLFSNRRKCTRPSLLVRNTLCCTLVASVHRTVLF